MIADIPDLTGCVAIVTGGNSGIGYQTVKQLAQRGAKVYMGARSESKATAAIQRLHDEGLGDRAGEIVWLDLDLTYPSKAKAAAQYILSHEQRLDILINNAGILSEFSLNADGLSENMVVKPRYADLCFTSHLSPFLFTNTLLPLMIATAALPDSDVRIVNVSHPLRPDSPVHHQFVDGTCTRQVSSQTHAQAKNPRFDTLEALNQPCDSKWTLLGYTKLANILHAKELQKRLDAQGSSIIVTAIHPGMVMSEGAHAVFSAFPLGSILVQLFSLFTTPTAQAGDPSVFAAAAPAVRAHADAYKGAYLVPVGKISTPSPDAMIARLAQELWATSEKQLAVLGL
ncbi:hypothetical protein HWV62_4109 [Athelia sp. TMB]|nr:hypothetical protein HWV62_4109 [Athelia sp. TMB]